MNWVMITLIALFLWAITNIIDKAVVSKYFKRPIIYSFFSGFFLALPLLAIPYFGLAFVSWEQTVLALLSGAIYLYALIPFYYAIFDEEVSRVIPVWQLMPLFVLLLSYLFIGEVLTGVHLAAFVLLVSGSILISLRKVKKLFKLNKAFYLTLFSAFLFAIQYVMSKYVYLNQSYVNGFLWIRIGSVLAVIPLFFVPSFRKGLIKTFKVLKAKVIGAIAVSNFCIVAGLVLLNYALSLNSVTLISAMEGVQSVFVLILAIFISRWKPSILEEDMDKKTLFIKIIAIVMIVAGVYLVNV